MARLAGNVGQFATDQALQQHAMEQRRLDQQDDYHNALLQLNNQRAQNQYGLGEDRIAGQYGVQGLRNQGAEQRLGQQTQAQMDRATLRDQTSRYGITTRAETAATANDARLNIAAQNSSDRLGIANQANDTQLRGQDYRLTGQRDAINAANDRAAAVADDRQRQADRAIQNRNAGSEERYMHAMLTAATQRELQARNAVKSLVAAGASPQDVQNAQSAAETARQEAEQAVQQWHAHVQAQPTVPQFQITPQGPGWGPIIQPETQPAAPQTQPAGAGQQPPNIPLAPPAAGMADDQQRYGATPPQGYRGGQQQPQTQPTTVPAALAPQQQPPPATQPITPVGAALPQPDFHGDPIELREAQAFLAMSGGNAQQARALAQQAGFTIPQVQV